MCAALGSLVEHLTISDVALREGDKPIVCILIFSHREDDLRLLVFVDGQLTDSTGSNGLVECLLQVPCRIGGVGQIDFLLIDERGIRRMGFVLVGTLGNGFSHGGINACKVAVSQLPLTLG